MVTEINRPVLRYHGGKWKLAPWLIQHFPPHRSYVEAFGGAASVLMRKPASFVEVYNDLDSEVVNVFRVLRDPTMAAELEELLRLTPFSRAEFRAAYEEPSTRVERAHHMIVRSFMGFGSASMTRMHVTGFRSNSSRNGTTPAVDWSRWPDEIAYFTERLKGVVIEQRNAIEVMGQHDKRDTLHYVDPPYVAETRSSLKNKNGNRGHYYRHDFTDAQHRELGTFLRGLKGMVIVSGYRNPLYDELFEDWVVREVEAMADGARERIEVIWMNSAAASAQRQQSLIA